MLAVLRPQRGGRIALRLPGWKYDVAGNCLDTPNLPADQDFREKIKAKAYKVAERNGMVYV